MEMKIINEEEAPENALLSGEIQPEEHRQDASTDRGQWSSQIEYLLTLIGFSVGLGNVWRFPYICSRNGGGAFLIPFLICLMLCGLPLFLLELSIGQFSARSPVHVWALCPLMKATGLGMVIMAVGIPIYYTVVCAWTLYYTIFSCRTDLPWTSCDNPWNTDNCVTSVKQLKQAALNYSMATDYNESTASYQTNTSSVDSEWDNQTLSHTSAEEFWQYNVLGITEGLSTPGSIRWELALCLFASWFIMFLCIAKSIRSVGKAVYITATLPYVILTVLLVRGLTLPGGPSGALYYVTPDFNKLLNLQVWIEASVQVFYSLGPTWGGLITMSSYNKFHTNCYRNAIICTLVGEGTSLFAGLVVFSVLGFMANEADVPISDVVSSGPGLGFVIYPEALAQLPLPQLWSFIFFIMLIMLALGSMFGEVEAVLSAIMDEFPFLLRWRVHVAASYCFVCYLVGLVFTTQGGMYVFQLVDWYWPAIFPIMCGFLECVVLGWVYGIERFSSDIEMMIGRRAPAFFKVSWCFITPVVLLTTFIFTLSKYKPPTYGRYVYPEYASTIGLCLAFVPLFPVVVVFGLAIYRGKGSLTQRLRQSLVPDKTWYPSEPSYRKLYLEKWKNEGTAVKQTCSSFFSCKS